MAIIPVGFGLASIPLNLAGYSRTAFVTFGVRNDAVLADPNTAADRIESDFEDQMGPRFDSDVTIGPCHLLLNVSAGPLPGDATSTESGGSSANSPTPNVALLIRKSTLTPGRTGRGRMYLPWAVDESGLDQAGGVEGAVVTATTDAFNNLLEALDGDGLPMVLLHTGAGVPSEVISGVCEGTVATQKRRLVRT
jgi:hypothetical protein